MEEVKLTKKIFINGNIICKTGLHIGGSGEEMSIGGVDNIVIRDPLTNAPYIPGSSLKGKMRSLLDKCAGIDNNGNHLDKSKGDLIFKVFGPRADEKKEIGRLIVRDAFITEESIQRLSALETELPYTEVKTEVTINRVTSEANPRQMERVPAGAEFDFELVLNIFEGDDDRELLSLVFEGMMLLQDDYLGGSGTRGYGKISFKNLNIKYRTIEDYIAEKPAKAYEQYSLPETFK